MKTSLNALFLSVVVSLFFSTSVQAALVIYTDHAAWESDAFLSLQPSGRFSENFEGVSPQALSAENYLFGNVIIDITGAPGSNSIDDSLTPDPFSDTLSPNGSTYYLGQTGGGTSSSLGLYQGPLGASVWAFGADWKISGDFAIEVAGTTISFSDYLPSGTGFLGLYVESLSGGGAALNNLALVAVDGTVFFGMDNVQYTAQGPIPPAVWLFGSGLLGLIGISRRKKAA